MHQQEHGAMERRERCAETKDMSDGAQIPRLLPSHTKFAQERAANCLLGLLASHADKQLPLLDRRQMMIRRQQQTVNYFPVISHEAAASAKHPTTLQRSEERQQEKSRLIITSSSNGCIEDKVPLALPLVAFLGRSNKCGSPRLPDNVTSPRSVWEASPMNERLDPTASPRQTVASPSRLDQTPPTTSSWRMHNLLSPDPTVTIQPYSSHKSRTPFSSSPQEHTDGTARALKRPRISRRVSSQWRHEVFPRDRAQTRERILRSLHSHCQGDYEKLVMMVSSMEEELLHIKTTSSDVYVQQSFELSSLIEHATLER